MQVIGKFEPRSCISAQIPVSRGRFLNSTIWISCAKRAWPGNWICSHWPEFRCWETWNKREERYWRPRRRLTWSRLGAILKSSVSARSHAQSAPHPRRRLAWRARPNYASLRRSTIRTPASAVPNRATLPGSGTGAFTGASKLTFKTAGPPQHSAYTSSNGTLPPAGPV
jgi:hypothetical protein